MKFIESLKHSAYVQCQAFFFNEIQKALGLKTEQLLQWLGFDPILLDLTSDETVFIHRLELPTFELIPFSEQLEFAYNAAGDISQQYVGIYAVIGYDEESGIIVVYLSSEDVTLEALEMLLHVDDEDQDQPSARKASVHALSLVPNGKAPTGAVEAPIAPSEPVAAPTLAESADDEDEEEPETFETEDTALQDVLADEPFNEEMLTIEQTEALDVMRKDEDAVAFIRNGLTAGVAQFDSFVEFNDVSDFPMPVVYAALELYEQFKSPTNSDVAQIFGEEQPDTFDVEEAPDEFPTEEEPAHVEAAPEVEAPRVAPLGGQRAEDAAVAEAAQTEEEEHAARFAQILQDVAAALPNDSLSEIADGGLNVIMSRVVPNANGVGMSDVDYNLRLTIRREMFANVKMIDKYRLENNGELIVETGSLQVIIENLNNL